MQPVALYFQFGPYRFSRMKVITRTTLIFCKSHGSTANKICMYLHINGLLHRGVLVSNMGNARFHENLPFGVTEVAIALKSFI